MAKAWAGVRGLCGLLAVVAVIGAARGQDRETPAPPFLLTADELIYDREREFVTASGDVEVSYADRVLIADTMTYNQRSDLLAASGNITLLEPTGEVVFAEHMKLTGDLKDGILEDLRVILQDRARIAANGARRSEGSILEMSRAVYSPCNLCPEEPSRPPLWQLKAVKVVHDKRSQTIEYSDAWLEIAGLPVAYTPYLFHPDPTVKRRSGLLPPSAGGSSDLGFVTQVPYYFAIDPHSDATVTPIYTTKEGPVLAGEYRRRMLAGSLDLSGSITEDSEDDVRGHIVGEGRFDLDDTWRWGFDIDRATDDTYLRRYGFGSAGTLTSGAFAEGFRKRNYMAVNGYAFQGLRESDDPGETPLVLPMFEYNHVGEAGRLGERSTLDASLLALTRTEGADVRRLSVGGGWRLPYVGRWGDVYALSASLQGDLYHVNGVVREGKSDTFNGITGRILPQIALDWRYPFVRQESRVFQFVEPVASVIASPYGGNSSKIPNEDSLDFEFDDTNLFSTNRFTGLDRVEGGPRINYGLKWGVFGRGGGNTTFLFGQRYRVKEDDTFAQGSGLEEHFSDLVGRVHVVPGDWLDLLYRARWDKDNFALRRSEAGLLAGPPSLRLAANYIFFDRQENAELPTREEIKASLDAKLTRYWRSRMSAVHDLASGGGARSFGIAFTYEDECLVFSTDLIRTFFKDRDLEPTDAVIFRITFKTLGEVRTAVR